MTASRLPLPDLIARLAPVDGAADRFAVDVPPDWMQGRTLYGGISAALAHAAVRRAHPDLPPLRSAQMSFVGPASGSVRIETRMLRAGRSATSVAASLSSEAGAGTEAVFTFGAARPSAFDQARLVAPAVPGPDDCPPFFGSAPGAGPAFTAHFEVRHAAGPRPLSGAAEAEIVVWMRAREGADVDFDTRLLALADVPPPAAMALFVAPAPVSTMTWMLTRLADAPDPAREDADWLLCRTVCDDARAGYSSQSMQVWSRSGAPLASALQSVAVFA